LELFQSHKELEMHRHRFAFSLDNGLETRLSLTGIVRPPLILFPIISDPPPIVPDPEPDLPEYPTPGVEPPPRDLPPLLDGPVFPPPPIGGPIGPG
jgi:hypothetical protein